MTKKNKFSFSTVLPARIKRRFNELGWKIITTVIVTLTAVVTFVAYAAFVEPTSLPSASDQDFVQNILGANNSNNDFNSSSVTANQDGSIIEILEYIQTQL